ncbi:MAG TPA: DNA-directed RNA polymerase subunit beta [Dehalococcoidia bacterium]|nr:DNA-directed RNA polymerase subunit beta [Dehalococcoidia bacterium]
MSLDTEKDLYPVARKSYARLPQILPVPNLIEVQLESFRWFHEEGLRQVLEEVSPIRDFTGNRLELNFISYEFREPRHTESECLQRDLTYSAPLYVKTRLLIKGTGEIKEQDLFLGDIPLMTVRGTFITSGAERVVVSQLLRSPGVYFTVEEDASSGRGLCHAKLISNRGAWLEFDTTNSNVISAKINGKRKIPVTTLLRAIGYGSDEELLSLFTEEDNDPDNDYIRITLEREPGIRDQSDAMIDIYRKLRPGDPPNLENAKKLITGQLFDSQHYDLGIVGRYKMNKRLGLDVPESQRALTKEDLVEIVRHIIMVNNGNDTPDDIDHLGNRRTRTVGELMQNQFRIGLMRLERVAKERMSTIPTEAAVPSSLINTRPVVAAIREFFSSSQLSQFMQQTNPLDELTHKRRLSAMGPGGLSRERAGFEARDVHYSHYGRICPIETPEGPNVGLIGSLATYSRINKYGFIETPYRRIIRQIGNTDEQLAGRTAREDVLGDNGTVLVAEGAVISKEQAAALGKLSSRNIQVVPFASYEIVYMTADVEDKYLIAQADIRLNEKDELMDRRIEAKLAGNYLREAPERIDFMDISSKQIFSVSAALIPFLEHDDANRALMGSNMQRQAVPLLRPSAPLVATGMEAEAAKHSGQVLLATNAGVASSVTGSEIVITRDDGHDDVYPLIKFTRTNQGTCINQRPIVGKGDRVKPGHVLVDSSSTEHGELALGQNLLCAFMSWEGYNYEDAIVLSSRLVEKDTFTSIHIEKYEVEARDTKLGPEEITRDIPNVGEESLRELDEDGIVRIGAKVGPDDILVGKITPKGETELSAEEKLLRAIFGEKAREVKDTSLRVPHGEWGKVVNVKVFSGDDLPAGVNQWVQVWVAQKRPVSVGDKLAGRHGNKGVVSIIAPVEDMPFLPDGTPVDVILNPIGVPGRMNIGQVLETHLGWIAQVLGVKVMTPVFDGADDTAIEDALARAWFAQKSGAVDPDPSNGSGPALTEQAIAWVDSKGYDGSKAFGADQPGKAKEICLRLWLEEHGVHGSKLKSENVNKAVNKITEETGQVPPTTGKVILHDGRTGSQFDRPITVGNIYVMKLNHLVEDKVHARSTGPYSLISQQPLGGKAQFGGQRFGEMEVWTLEAYGAAHNLQEMLTIKSDDVSGRTKAYEAIVKNEDILQPSVPESFKVLVKELQSLGLSIEVIKEESKTTLAQDAADEEDSEEAEVTGGEEVFPELDTPELDTFTTASESGEEPAAVVEVPTLEPEPIAEEGALEADNISEPSTLEAEPAIEEETSDTVTTPENAEPAAEPIAEEGALEADNISEVSTLEAEPAIEEETSDTVTTPENAEPAAEPIAEEDTSDVADTIETPTPEVDNETGEESTGEVEDA